MNQSVDWRRKDSAYAAATAIAAALVAYVVAGNFGLVPSPLSPAALGGGTRVAVAPPRATATSPPNPFAPVVPIPSTAPTAPPPPATPAPDRTAPSGAITTASGAQAPVDQPASVSGTARDMGSGVGGVDVIYTTSGGTSTTVPAALSCDSARTTCRWSSRVPATVGSYKVTAMVKDKAGNKRDLGPIDVTVVNVGGAVDDLSNGGLVGDVVGAVQGLLSL